MLPKRYMLAAIEEGSSHKQQVKAVKSISFEYSASSELSSLFEDFRLMCNDAIRIALNERSRNRFNLMSLAYPRLKLYGLHTHYILTACEVAFFSLQEQEQEISSIHNEGLPQT